MDPEGEIPPGFSLFSVLYRAAAGAFVPLLIGQLADEFFLMASGKLTR